MQPVKSRMNAGLAVGVGSPATAPDGGEVLVCHCV